MSDERIATGVGPDQLDITYETRGEPADPTVALVMGIAAQLVHGLADTMCDPSGGRATAAAIPGAELLLIEGMGHNLPPQLWQQLADAIAATVGKGEARRPLVMGAPRGAT